MYTIQLILKELESLSCQDISSSIKPLLISECKLKGIKKSDISIGSHAQLKTGYFWSLCSKKLFEHFNSVHLRNPTQYEWNELLSKLIPNNKKNLKVLLNCVKFLLENYNINEDQEIHESLALLRDAILDKLEKLNRITQSLLELEEQVQNIDPKSYLEELQKYKQQIQDFKKIAKPSDLDIEWLNIQKKEYQKLELFEKAYNAYNQYRLEHEFVPEDFKRVSINEDSPPNELLKFCNYLLAEIDKKYDHAGKEKEQLFQLKLNLSSLSFELRSLTFLESEKESERVIQELQLLTDEEEEIAMEHIRNTKKIVDIIQRKVNYFLELETLTTHWKEVTKQKLLDLYLKERPFLDKSLFIQKNALVHLDKFHLSRIAMLAEDNYFIRRTLEQYNFCVELETILATNNNPISKRLDLFFKKSRTGSGRFLTQDEHCQKILKIWIGMVTGMSSQRFALFAPDLLVSKFLQHEFKENEASIDSQTKNTLTG